MTQYERMLAGLIYDPGDPDILEEQRTYQDRLWAFNQLMPSETLKKEQFMKEMFAECGEGCYIELPFRANWGGHHVYFGNRIYANYNLTLVDDGHIYVGDCVMFGPNVTISTAAHPVAPKLREKGFQFNKDVRIGRNVWIGAGVMIMPGVSIGDDAVIGAGSVVTKDIPAGTVAFGTPCRVVRAIGEQDQKYYYHDDIIDWNQLIDER